MDSPFAVGFAGTPSQKEYDIYDSNETNNVSMYFHRKGLKGLRVINTSSKNLLITKIELLLESDVFGTITFPSGSMSIRASGEYWDNYYFDIDSTAPDFDLNSSAYLEDDVVTNNSLSNEEGQPDIRQGGYTATFKNNLYFTSSGTKNIYIKVYYAENSNFSSIVNETTYQTYIYVYNLRLTNLWVDTTVTKTEYELNEEFDSSNIIAYASYSRVVSGIYAKTIEVSSFTCTSPNMSSEGVQDITITYGNRICTFQITVAATLTKTLEVDFSPLDGNIFYIHGWFPANEIKGTFTIDTKIPSEDDEYPIITNVNFYEFKFMLDGIELETSYYSKLPGTSGNYTLYAIYEHEGIEYQNTYKLKINPTSLERVSIQTSPSRQLNSYIEGQSLDLSGLSFTLIYNVSSSNTIIRYDDSLITYYINGKKIKINEKLLSEHKGGLLTANIKGKEVAIGTLEIEDLKVESITIKTLPTKTKYKYGDIFTLKGVVLYATYNDTSRSQEEIYYSPYSVTSSFDNKTFDESDQLGAIQADITYILGSSQVTTSFEIELSIPKFDHIELDTTNVINAFTNNTAFSTNGLIVYAVYENGFRIETNSFATNAETVLNLVDGKINCDRNYGEKEILVKGYDKFSYDFGEAIYIVNVESAKQIVSAYLMVDETATEYNVGDTYTAKGAKIHVIDVDGDEAILSNFITNPPKGTPLKSAQKIDVEVTYKKGTFIYTKTYSINVRVTNSQNFVSTDDYQIAIGDKDGTLFHSLVLEDGTIQLGNQNDGSFLYPIFHKNVISIDNNVNNLNTYGYNVYVGNDASKDCIGYMDLGLQDGYGNQIRNAHVILFEDVNNPIEGDGNITVTYPHFIKGYADRINNCKFGKIYNNRLFVSGNQKYKNCDWHTSEINVAQTENYDLDSTKDFTYFSDLDYCRYGSDETAVVGYDIYRDGDLIVFKETSSSEATLYKRTSSLINAMDYAGNVLSSELVEEGYPCFDINSNGGEGSFTPRTITNFVGDTLFLTRNGLKVLTSKETTSNNAKYTYDVSSYINPKITHEELENARLFAYKERLILKTKRGIYFGEYNLRNEKNEYEWYFIENVNADIFFELDNELYFADNNGNFNKFVKDSTSYVDIPRTFVSNGGVLLVNEYDKDNMDTDGDGFGIDENRNVILISNKYSDEVAEGKDFHLITTYTNNNVDSSCLIHASLGSFINKDYKGTYNNNDYVGNINTDANSLKNNTISLFDTSDVIDLYYEGRTVYIDYINKNTNEQIVQVYIDTPYTLKKANDNFLEYSYYLIDKEGKIVDLLGVNDMRLSIIVNDLEIAKITNVNSDIDGSKTFSLIGDHDRVLDLIFYNDRNDRYSGVITSKQNVQAYYRTKPYNMGTRMYEKTIWSWTVVNDSGLESFTDVGYIASTKQNSKYNLAIDASAFNTNSFNFSTVRFTNNNLPHVYIRNKTLPNITFVEFIFRNDDDSNMVLSQMSLLYSISQLTRGVK